MKIYEVIGDFLLNTSIVEQALRRSDIESKITNESGSVIEHLIKILKWSDPIHYDKHCTDINGWLKLIARLKMKQGGKPKQRDYYQWMFTDNVGDVSELAQWVESLVDYHGLPVIRTDAEVYTIIDNIMYRMSVDFSNNKFNAIQHYL